LLAQEVAAKYPGQVRFVSENLGESKLAERFGVKQYPVIFVDDVLIARPQDFGFFGGEKGGRYSPWIDAKSHEKFKLDLTRMINLVLSGKKEELKAERAGTAAADENIAALPAYDLVDLAGNRLTPEQVRGRVVLVEFWATWCPPCRSTLGWLGDLRRKYGDNLAVLAFAVASPEDEVRKTAQSLSPDLHWAIASPETAQAFGDLTATPTLFLFDRQGKTAGVFYGAPPDLHAKVEKTLNGLIR
jgi:thiol-disulfide isomerase/thioredoxin